MLISSLIAEDHDLTRQGIRSLLEDRLGARVCATTGNGLDVFSLLQEHEPDLLVLDLGLPHLNGLDVLRQIQGSALSVQVVVLSMHAEDIYVSRAFELGAAGYVLKGASLDEMVRAVRTVVGGNRYLSDDLSDALLNAPQSTNGDADDRYQTLTAREREVLQLTAEGYTSQEIGEHLHISPRTADKHRQNIKAKLELKNVAEMTAYAHRRGLITG